MTKNDIKELKHYIILSQKLDDNGFHNASREILSQIIVDLTPLDLYKKEIEKARKNDEYRLKNPNKLMPIETFPEDIIYEEKDEKPQTEIPTEVYENIIKNMFNKQQYKENLFNPERYK